MRLGCVLAAFAAAGLVACGGADDGKPALSPQAALGQLAFNDPILSASGRQSCASCHSPDAGHAAPNDLAVQLGGPDLDVPGLRASPPIRYLAKNTAFHFDEEGAPAGGFFWDGRADSLAIQAGIPLLGAREMANMNKAAVVEKIRRASWAKDFQALHGTAVFDDVDSTFDKLTQAIARFELEEPAFHAFTSKYDAVLRGQATLTA